MLRRGEVGGILVILILLTVISYDHAADGTLTQLNLVFLLGIAGMCVQMLYRRYRR